MFYKSHLKQKAKEVSVQHWERARLTNRREREMKRLQIAPSKRLFSSRSQYGCVAASPTGVPLPGPSPVPHVGNGALSPALARSQLAARFSPAPLQFLCDKTTVINTGRACVSVHLTKQTRCGETEWIGPTTERGEKSHCKVLGCVTETDRSPAVAADRSRGQHISRLNTYTAALVYLNNSRDESVLPISVCCFISPFLSPSSLLLLSSVSVSASWLPSVRRCFVVPHQNGLGELAGRGIGETAEGKRWLSKHSSHSLRLEG